VDSVGRRGQLLESVACPIGLCQRGLSLGLNLLVALSTICTTLELALLTLSIRFRRLWRIIKRLEFADVLLANGGVAIVLAKAILALLLLDVAVAHSEAFSRFIHLDFL